MRKVLQRLYSVFMVVVVEIEFSIWYLGYAFLCSSYKRVSFKIIAITWPFSAVTILNAAQVCQVLQVYWWGTRHRYITFLTKALCFIYYIASVLMVWPLFQLLFYRAEFLFLCWGSSPHLSEKRQTVKYK